MLTFSYPIVYLYGIPVIDLTKIPWDMSCDNIDPLTFRPNADWTNRTIYPTTLSECITVLTFVYYRNRNNAIRLEDYGKKLYVWSHIHGIYRAVKPGEYL